MVLGAGGLVLAQTGAVGSPYQRPGLSALVSVSSNGDQGSANSADPQVTPDGRFVTFFSHAENLVAGDRRNTGDVFLRDTVAGRTELVSVAAGGGPGDRDSFQGAPSAEGRYIVFLSSATNLVPGDPLEGFFAAQVYVRDRVTGTTERVTRGPNGGVLTAGAVGPAISPNGRLVAYTSGSGEIVPNDTNRRNDVFLYDRETRITERLSTAADGTQGNGSSSFPAFSGDGRVLAFYSTATNLVAGDKNGFGDVFVRTLATGAIERVSVASDGTEGNEESFTVQSSLSYDGRLVAFQSAASNLVPTDTNAVGAERASFGTDVFVRDRAARRTERVSVTTAGGEFGNQRRASGTSISADGRYAAFQVFKAEQDPGDFNARNDVYVRDRLARSTDLASATRGGEAGNGGSENPALSADGRRVVFHTDASDLVPGDANEATDIVTRERGGPLEVLSLTARREEDRLEASGLAVLSGREISAVDDPDNDAVGSTARPGGELTRASIVQRPEDGDLLVRLEAAKIPSSAAGAPAPTGVVFGLDFTLNGEPWQVRGSRRADTGDGRAPTAFGLYHCKPVCRQVQELEGGYGTAGDEVTMSVPFAYLGLSEGETFARPRAFTATGDSATGPVETIDQATLPDATLRTTSAALGVADAAAETASYDGPASLFQGRISGTITPAPGRHKVLWARVCFDDACAERSAPIPGPPSFSIDDVEAIEGDSGTRRATFTISRSGASSGTQEVTVGTGGGTAEPGTDYAPVSPTTVTFGPEEVTKSVEITINGDLTNEPDETFNVLLSAPTGGAELGKSTGVGTILDDDPATIFSVGDASVVEGDAGQATLAFTITKNGPAAGSVRASTADGTAIAGRDYDERTEIVSFAADEASKSFAVAVNGDTVDEPDETLVVRLDQVSGGTLGDGDAVGTIADDDPQPPLPSLAIDDVSADEGDSGESSFAFTITKTGTGAATVTVNTVDGTATAPGDYTAIAPHVVELGADETTKTVSVNVAGETNVENDETFFVVLTDARGATVSDDDGLGLIRNDDRLDGMPDNRPGVTPGDPSPLLQLAPFGPRPRGLPRVTARTTPRFDRRRPYRFRTSGGLILPAGTAAASACGAGRVTVQVRVVRTTVSTRNARITKDCRFVSRVTFHRRARLGRGRLRVRVRWLGNALLKPARARTRFVRVR